MSRTDPVVEKTEMEPAAPAPSPDMAWVPGGVFLMGSDRHYPEEGPAHQVKVDGFWIDKYQVTNAAYGVFVDETGYQTVAERPLEPSLYPGASPENLVPGSMVFTPPSDPVDLMDYTNWWAWTPGANWRHPEGPGSSIESRGDHPVVHIAYEDAAAYTAWLGRELPTEAEWERAARGGLEGAEYVWGDEKVPDGVLLANWWQGEFPWQNTLDDGYGRTAPVGRFAPNGYGLCDMAGNVWEWTTDWFTTHREVEKACCIPENPRGGAEETSHNPHLPQFNVPRRVVKGGSFLCADNYCMRYRPAARQAQDVDTGMSHIGFRTKIRLQNTGD